VLNNIHTKKISKKSPLKKIWVGRRELGCSVQRDWWVYCKITVARGLI
jgi:hypothetical protein